MKVVKVIFFMFIALFFLIGFFGSYEDSPASLPPDEFDTDDFNLVDTIDGELLSTHYRVWKDVDDSRRDMNFSISSMANARSFYYRDTMNIAEDGTEKGFWRNFYFGLYDHDKETTRPLRDSILSLVKRDSIRDDHMIYTVVSLVQDIPYNYILSADSCATHTDYPCVPLQRYGILSPVEFLYSLSGDCDTRTVLLFTLLKEMGFDPIIVNSREYGHSMLAVDIPTGGDYFNHKGRKFYFWETTATGWMRECSRRICRIKITGL
ncbi:MAG: hypothetical protein WDN75_20075 [Bacteroidota bacterium]